MFQQTFSFRPVLFISKVGHDHIHVFQNPSKDVVSDAFRKLDVQEWDAYDCFQKKMDTTDAKNYIMALLNDISNLFRPEKDGRVIWNILNKDLFVAQVRTDVLDTDFTKFTATTEDSVLAKLTPIIPILDVGMYSTAIKGIDALPIDEYITIERKELWKSMLSSANALP